jgi:hypothetical protein
VSIQLSVDVRNARLDSIETVIAAAPVLTLRTGAPPANCAAANAGTVIATLVLPSDFMAAAASGAKAKAGAWADPAADAAGTVAHFRIHDASATTCHVQGTVTITGGGGDMTIDNPVVAVGQIITVISLALTDGNA